ACLSTFSSVFAQEQYPQVKAWENFDFRGRNISAKDLSDLTVDDLKLVRGIIFGKHGRIFKDPDIKLYLHTRAWYKPDAEFKNSMLNDTERENLDVIRLGEAAQHETVEPGDMRLYENKALTRKKLGTHTNAEWTVLVSEIEAIHGKRFDDDPW